MVDCESVSKVEDDPRLSPERGEEDSHQLDSSSMIEAGEGGYSCPMEASEFDSVGWTVLGELTSSSRSDKEAVPTCSRAAEEDFDCGRFSVAEDADSDTCSVAKVLDFNTCSVAKVLGSVCPPVVE